jgi:hypothetical protein
MMNTDGLSPLYENRDIGLLPVDRLFRVLNRSVTECRQVFRSIGFRGFAQAVSSTLLGFKSDDTAGSYSVRECDSLDNSGKSVLKTGPVDPPRFTVGLLGAGSDDQS